GGNVSVIQRDRLYREDGKLEGMSISALIGFEPVLFVDKRLEITDVITERLNARYRAAKKDKEAAGKEEKPAAAAKPTGK
ncbi:MAG: hypothetical protein GY844_28450, partial [Bradyrhizobium sp.]|nr:hypothetical protein [Bradyrhizobium sp.]